MNIVKVLKEKGETVTLLYYGKDDMASGFQAKALIDNKQEIEQYYNESKARITSVDEYVDFLFIDNYAKLIEVIPVVREDLKEELKDIIESLINVRKHYKSCEINRFIKKEYRILLCPEKLKQLELNAYDIVEYTLNHIKDNYQIFKDCIDLYKYVFTNYAYKIFDQLEYYKSVLKKHPGLLDILFSEKILTGQMNRKIEQLEEAFNFLKKENVDLYHKAVEIVTNMVRARSFDADIESVTYTYDDIKSCKKFLKIIGDNNYEEFNIELKKQEKLLNEYIKKNGHESKYQISIAEFLKLYNDLNVSWEFKSLIITHTKERKKIYSRIKSVVENTKTDTFMDRIGVVNVDTNDYFTYSVQTNLSIVLMFGKFIINYMLFDEEKFHELMNYMFAGVANYVEKSSIDMPNIDDDFNMLSASLKYLITERQKKEQDELILEFWCYNTIHLIIGIIEKVLREICYKYVSVNKYIPYSSLTLEKILAMPETSKFFGEANVKAISYFLVSDNFVGKNLRNDICHFNNNIKEICTFDNVLNTLYILLTITNELLLKVIQIS